MTRDAVDIAIVGGGLVGASLAAALAKSKLTVALIESAPPPSGDASWDERCIALNAAAKSIFESIGVWDDLERVAEPIVWTHISERGKFGVARFTAEEAGLPALGYNADITRCFPANGKFSPAQKAVYEVVLAAQLAAIAELRVGNPTSRPHEVATRKLTEGMVALGLLKGTAAEAIEKETYKQFFMHKTGHWLGMDVHDVGRYKLNGEARPFVAGMIMTVEPGLYVSPGTEGVDRKYWGIGVRIEDDVLVTDQGPVVLTADVPKTVSEIEALMRG